MSIGRPDPNAFKVVTPDAYNQNLAEIARARAALEAYEKMNEAGRSNYDRLMEQEERELEQKIQEGMAARQRLQELRNQKANGYLEGSSRIEEVGNTNATGYDPARHTAHSAAVASTSFAQHHQNNYPANPQTVNNNPGTVSSYPPQHYPYSASVEHPQSSNYAYNGRPTQFLSHNGIASRPTIQQTYPPQMPVQSNNNVQGHFDTSNNDQHRTSQAPSVQYRPQPQMQSGTSYHPNGPNQSQVPPRPSQSSMTNPYNQRQSYSDVHYQQQVPRTNNASSSLVNALGTVSSSNTASAASNTNTSAKSITPVSSTVPPIASSSRHGKAKDERRPSQSTAPGTGTTAKDPDIIIPTLPTREQVSVCKEYFDKWAARVPPQTEYTGAISCGKHSIKCIKHTDGSIRFLFNLQTGIVHMWASKFLDGLLSTAQQPIDHSPIAQPETIPQPSSSASKPPTNESSTKSTDLAPAANQGQDVSAPVESKEKEPSLSSLQGQDSVSTPQTPTPRPVERRVGTITSPHQADKKRIAQSVLFALGKRRRESDKLPEAASQASKKQALGPIVNGKSQDIPPNAESSKRDSATAKSHTTTNNTESKPTNTIPPTAPPPMQTSTSVFPSLPRIDVPAATPTVVPTSSQQAVRGYPYQNYNQTNFFNPVTAPPNMQYVKFTPLNPYYGWRAVSSASSAAPPSTSQTPVPTSQASEKKSNDSGKTSVSDSTSKTTLPSVGNITKPKVLDNKRRPSKSPPKSLQKDPSVSQPSVPAPTQSSSSVTASNNAVANKNNTADDLIPQIAYLKSPSRKSPEPVASSSKLAPPKEPLFLPSSPSPQNEGDLWGTESARDDIDELDHQQPTKPRMKPKVNLAYVLVPPAPEYLVRYRQRQEKQKQKMAESRSSSSSVSFGAKRRIGTRTNSSVSTPFGEEDFINSGESQPPVLEEEEREAIQLACSRLQVAPCRWDGCDAELNSVEALIRHLNLHKPEATQHTKTFMCRWRQCGQQGIKIEDVHLEKHALLPLRCAYTGCDDTFRSPSQLLRHFRTRHSGDELKPSTKLAPPSTLPDLPPIPGIIPSYLIVTSLAGREVLSKERHNIISPQVLKGMTSEQNAPTRRSRKNARPASRPAPSVTRTDLTNDYNFLENNNSARSSTYFSKASDLEYSDLDSEAVNKIYERGIVLLGSDDGTELTERDIMDEDVDIELMSPPSSPLQRRESRGEVVGVKRGLEKGPNVRPDEHSSDEDAAVETMLTDMTSMGTSIS